MNGRYWSGKIPPNQETLLYELTNKKMDFSVFTITVTNDNPYQATISFGFKSNNDYHAYEDRHILEPYQSLERTGLITKGMEQVVALSDQDNTYWRVHGYQDYMSKLVPLNIEWITESEIGEIYGKINIQFVARNADQYELFSGSLPPNTTLTSSGLLTGNNKKTNASYTFTLKATNRKGVTSYRTFNLRTMNNLPDISKMVVKIPRRILKSQYLYGYIYGATDADGDPVEYILTLPKELESDKNIVKENERFKITVKDKTVPSGTIVDLIVQASDGFVTSKENLQTIKIEILDGDILPDPFSFTTLTNLEKNAECESNIVHVTGLEPNVVIYLTSNTSLYRYSDDPSTINTKPFLAYDYDGVDTGNTGSFYLQLKTNSSSKFNTSKIVNIKLLDTITNWELITRKGISKPTDFNIPDVIDAEIKTYYISDIVKITGLDANEPIKVTAIDGEIDIGYVKNGLSLFSGVYEKEKNPITDSNGEFILRAKNISADVFSEITTMTVTVGEMTRPFRIITRKLKDVPTNFKTMFTDKIDVELNSKIYSDTVLLTGLEPDYIFTFTVITQEGSISASTPPKQLGTYSNTYSVRTNQVGNIRIGALLQSSTDFLSKKTMTIQIDADRSSTPLVDRQASFSVTTRNLKDTPNQLTFDFGSIVNAEYNKGYISPNIVKLTGLEKNYSYIISGDNGLLTFADNNTASNITNTNSSHSSINTWYKNPITFTTNNNGEIFLRSLMTSLPSSESTIINTVLFGKAKGVYTITTKEDIEPDDFDFIDLIEQETNQLVVSNIVTISGLSKNKEITVSVTNGKVQVSNTYITGSFTPSTTSVVKIKTDNNGQLFIRLGTTSSNNFNTEVVTIVTVGSKQADWKVKTKSPKSSVSSFTNIDKTDVELNRAYNERFVISGLESGLSVKIIPSNAALTIVNPPMDNIFTVDSNGNVAFTGRLTSSSKYSSTIQYTFNVVSNTNGVVLSGDTDGIFKLTTRQSSNNIVDLNIHDVDVQCNNTERYIYTLTIPQLWVLETPVIMSIDNGEISIDGGNTFARTQTITNGRFTFQARVTPPSKINGQNTQSTHTVSYADKTESFTVTRLCVSNCKTSTRNYPLSGQKQIITYVEFNSSADLIKYWNDKSLSIPANTFKSWYRTEMTGLGIAKASGSGYGNVVLTGESVDGIGYPRKGELYCPYTRDVNAIINTANIWPSLFTNYGYADNLEGEVRYGYVTADQTAIDNFRKRNLRLKAGTNIEARAENNRINFYAELVEDYEDCT